MLVALLNFEDRKEKVCCMVTGRVGTEAGDRSGVQIACNTDFATSRDGSRWFERALAIFWMRALAG